MASNENRETQRGVADSEFFTDCTRNKEMEKVPGFQPRNSFEPFLAYLS